MSPGLDTKQQLFVMQRTKRNIDNVLNDLTAGGGTGLIEIKNMLLSAIITP